MPIEIREVVIRTQLEHESKHTSNDRELDARAVEQIRQEIVEDLQLLVEELIAQRFER